MTNHPNRNRKIAPVGRIVTNLQTAKAGDILDLGDGANYRYMLLSRSPMWEHEYWRVSGNRWMFSRQTFAQSGISFRVEGPRPVSDAEVDAYIARLTAADNAAGIE